MHLQEQESSLSDTSDPKSYQEEDKEVKKKVSNITLLGVMYGIK